MAIREGRWDCPSCGSKRIFGRHVDCPGCGKPRPEGVRFYLTDDAPIVTDPERLAEARAGADWICKHCGASTRAKHVNCGGCGAPRGGSPEQPVRRYRDGEVPRAGEASAPFKAAGFKSAPGEPRKRGLPAWIGGGLIAAVIGGGMLQECEPRERSYPPVAAVVEDLRWEREVVVSTHGYVAGEGWELPDSAVDVKEEPRIREYRQEVAGHESVQRVQPRQVQERVGERKKWVGGSSATTSCETVDMGNGYFKEVCEESGGSDDGEWVTEPIYRYRTVYDTTVEQKPYYRSVPVRAPYYTYRVPEWMETERRRTAGGVNTPPVWGDTTVGPNQRTYEQGRYQVIVRNAEGTRLRVWVDEDEWRKYRPGQPVAYAAAGGNRYRDEILSPDALPECQRWYRSRGRGKPPPDSLGCSPRGR
jgi:hypothetical protein